MVTITAKIAQLSNQVAQLKTLDIEAGETIQQVEVGAESFAIITGSWAVWGAGIGSSFTVNHYTNGVVNSVGVIGSLTMGPKTLIVSGGSGT